MTMSINTGFTYLLDGRYSIDKDPDDAMLYGRDLSSRFPGRTISSVVAVDVSGVTAGTPTHSGLVASVLVSGGTVGQPGRVTLRCTLDNGEITDRTLWFEIVSK